MELPQGLNVRLSTEIDNNADGEADFDDPNVGSVGSTAFWVNVDSLAGSNVISLAPVVKPANIFPEVRITVLDNLANIVEGLSISHDDIISGPRLATFDASTSQYVLDVQIDRSVEVMIPAFVVDGINYSSSTITLFLSSNFSGADQEIFVQLSNVNQSNWSYSVPATQEVIDIVVDPHIDFVSTDLEVVYRSSLPTENTSYRVFYSRAVSVPENTVVLVREDAYQVTQGNDSPDDIVLPGTTSIQRTDLRFPVSTQLSLNDTLLSVDLTPNLIPNYYYHYEIGGITDVLNDAVVDLNDNSSRFGIRANSAFDINAVVLDNDNFTNNGEAILPTNTAGEASLAVNRNDSVYLILPTSIETLENFTIRKLSVARGGFLELEDDLYRIVENGSVWSQKYQFIATAQNETILGDSTNFRGTSLDEGFYYAQYLGEFMFDHTNASTNTITFEYAYNAEGEPAKTGTLTLEVQ